MKYIRNNNFVHRNLMGKDMLFPIGKVQNNFQGAVLLDEVSLFIWNSLSEKKELSIIAIEVSRDFDVDYNTALNDIQN